MINVQLVTMAFCDGWNIKLPALPRSGDVIEIDTQLFYVVRVKFVAGSETVFVTVERNT